MGAILLCDKIEVYIYIYIYIYYASIHNRGRAVA